MSSSTHGKKGPVIILCHGLSTNKDGKIYLSLEKTLNENKISTFRFDFYGHGESEGKFEDITISEATDDILKAIDFLKKLGHKKIGLFGSSFGGISSIMAASRTKDLYILALKSPVSNYEEKETIAKTREEFDDWKQKGYMYYIDGDGRKLKLNYTFFEDFKNNNGYEAARKIKVPTLIVHGSKDETVPLEQSKRTASIIKNCRLEIIKGADHRYSRPEDFKRLIILISRFIVDNSR